MHDNIFELFQLEFIVSSKNNKKKLVVAPKDGIDDESIQKAQATIGLYDIWVFHQNKHRVINFHFSIP